MITHSYIGQAPIYSTELRCTIYPTPDYEVPEFVSLAELEKQREKFVKHSQHFSAQRSATKDMLVKWFTEYGPATTMMIAKQTGNSDKMIHGSIKWNDKTFVKLGVADDGYRSVIYGLVGQTLQDMTINCNVERLYHKIIKYLAEHGTSKVPLIAQALEVSENRVGSCLSSYRDVFENVRIGRHEFIWRLKNNDRS